jgi:hypothetical protein
MIHSVLCNRIYSVIHTVSILVMGSGMQFLAVVLLLLECVYFVLSYPVYTSMHLIIEILAYVIILSKERI